MQKQYTEPNCTNKQNNTQNQTVQISKTIQNYTNAIPTLHSQTQLYTIQPNTIQINLMHETPQTCAGVCENVLTVNACRQ